VSLNSAFTISRYFPPTGLGPMGRKQAYIGTAVRAAEARRSAASAATTNIALIKLLDDALRDELDCVLRYMSYGLVARRMDVPEEADRFQRYAGEESNHARRLNARIVQLGGEANAKSGLVDWCSAVVLDVAPDLPGMIRSSLSAEGASIDIYCRILNQVIGHDVPTQELIEEILLEELQHAEELWARSSELTRVN